MADPSSRDQAEGALRQALAAIAAERGPMPDAVRDEPMRILPADVAWPDEYAREADRLSHALRGALAAEIAHIGSTAVPDLDAVPVIDILIGLHQPARAEEALTALQRLGYESLGPIEAGGSGWGLRYRGGGPHYDVTLTVPDGERWRGDIAFRDHLRANPALARHYAAEKWSAATQGEAMLLAYRRRKRAAVMAVVRNAVPPTPAPSFEPLRLVPPSLEHLSAYEAALAGGWSPNTTRDVTGEQLAAMREDRAAFVAELDRREGGMVSLPDGTAVPRLPGRVFWIWDGGFCGAINFRHVPGTEALPPHVSGHIGYAIVPGRRNRGYATEALRLILPVARAAGMTRVLITCDADNVASRRVIEANGGVFARDGLHHGEPKIEFWVPTPP